MPNYTQERSDLEKIAGLAGKQQEAANQQARERAALQVPQPAPIVVVQTPPAAPVGKT